MKIEKNRDPMLGSVEISNLFITEYLPALDGNAAKIYLYLMYLSDNGVECTRESLAAILNMDVSVVDAALVQLSAGGIIATEERQIALENLARKEIERNYRMRTSRRPDEQEDAAAGAPERAAERAKIQMIRAVSDRFFSGQLPTAWYGEIDLWMEKYGFAPEVVYMLFQHCAKNNALTRPYIRKVADSWGGRFHIRTVEQLEEYFRKYEEYRSLRAEVARRLKLQAPLTEYQCEYIDKWFYTYGYGMPIISLALREGARAARPNFTLYDKILTDWYDHGVRTPEEVRQHLAQRQKKSREAAAAGQSGGEHPRKEAAVPQKNNFTERQYDEKFFERLYKEE